MADAPTPDELQEALGKIRIGDLLLQTVYTLSQLTYQRLTANPPDLAQARLGIDALAALVPVCDVPAEVRRDLDQMVTNLKLTFAAAAAPAAPAPAPEPEAERTPEPEPAPAPEPEAERTPEPEPAPAPDPDAGS